MNDSNNNGEIIIYQTEDNITKIQVRLEDDTVWLSQSGLVELFQTTKQNISLHVNNIFNEGELLRNSVVKECLTTASDGKNYLTKYYNLEVIIAVGYRVKSNRGTQFRIWATERLREYIVKGFTMDDERLKDVRNIGKDYFDEMLERIRDIRSSEKRFYQKIRDIYKLAIDYNPKSEATLEFFKIVQNKLHFAISGRTAAEIIHERADATKKNMGLTSWAGKKIRKADITIAKNYLNQDELQELNRIVTMYLDYAEDQAKRRNQIFMKDWRSKLDAFLKFNEREILDNPGKVSKEIAENLAMEQFEIYEHNRLKIEAEDEVQIDDTAFEVFLENIESQKKK